MNLYVLPNGNIKHIYQEELWMELGPQTITRVSHVEPANNIRQAAPQWYAHILATKKSHGPFKLRSEALTAERHEIEKQLETH